MEWLVSTVLVLTITTQDDMANIDIVGACRAVFSSTTGSSLDQHLVAIATCDHPIAARLIASSPKPNEFVVDRVLTFSRSLCGLSGSAEELGLGLLLQVWEQLRFCRRYPVLAATSDGLVSDAFEHLENVRRRCEARKAADGGYVEVGPDANILRVTLMVLKAVLAGTQHTPRLFLQYAQPILGFIEWADTVDGNTARELAEIFYLSRHIHGKVLLHVDGVDDMFRKSLVLQRFRSPGALELQRQTRKYSWATAETPTGPDAPAASLVEPPPWPTGVFSMETGIDVQFSSIASHVGTPFKAVATKKTTGKPAQLKGYLIPRPVDAGKPEHKQFPYEVVGRMKRHREKKEENAPSNSNDNNKPSEYKEWSCPACTCRNKGDAQVCVACGTKSPPRTKLAQKGQNPSAFQGWIDQAGALMYGWYGVARREEAWIGRKVHVESGSQNFFSADSTTAAYVGEDFEAHYGSFVTSSSSLKTAGLPAVHQKFSSTHNGFALAGAAKVVDGALLELGTIIAGETVPTDNLPGAVWSTSKFDVSRSLSIAFSMPPMDEAIVDRAARVVFLSGSWWNIDPLRLLGEPPVAVVSVEKSTAPLAPSVAAAPPPAPIESKPSDATRPSDALVANFMSISGCASQDEAAVFLRAANESIEQAMGLFFDDVQKARILSEASSTNKGGLAGVLPPEAMLPPSYASTVAASSAPPSPDAEAAFRAVCVDVVHKSSATGLPLLDIYVRQIDESGSETIVACVFNVLKNSGTTMKILYNTRNQTLAIVQNGDTALKLQFDLCSAIGADDKQIWLGMGSPSTSVKRSLAPDEATPLAGAGIRLNALVVDCSSDEAARLREESGGDSPPFEYEDTDDEDYFPKSKNTGADAKGSGASAASISAVGASATAANPCNPEEQAKVEGFMSVTGITRFEMAMQWVRGHKGDANAAVMAYFANPSSPPPLVPASGDAVLSAVVVDHETKTGLPTPTAHLVDPTGEKEVGAAAADAVPDAPGPEDLALKSRLSTLRGLLQKKFGAKKPCPESMLVKEDVWDTTIGALRFSTSGNETVEVIRGMCKKDNCEIYALGTVGGSVEATMWQLQGWWRDDRYKARNCAMFKFDVAATDIDGLLFRGDNIIEWKGKRQENAELLRNSPPNSTGQCGLVNGKDNLTNICFQNSLLQSLYMAPAFRRKLLDISRQPLDENGSNSAADTVVSALADLFAKMTGADKPSVASHDLQRALPSDSFGSGMQQDVSEFWDYLSNQFSLATSTSQVVTPDGRLESIAENLFGCLTQTSRECQKCGTVKTGKVEPYLDLPLPFPKRFQAITHLRVISGRGSEVTCPDGYERLGTNLNHGRENAPYVFLCIRRDHAGEVEPLTDITILHCASTAAQPVMHGWTILDGNLNAGGLSTSDRVYLAYKRGEGSPITNINIICGADTHVAEGYNKIAKDLNRGDREPVYLCYLQDLPIRDVMISACGRPGYTFIDRSLDPTGQKEMFFVHTDQGTQPPITGIELCDATELAGGTGSEFQVLHPAPNDKLLVARRGNGCPLTDIHVFRAPHVRPKIGYPDYMDLVSPNTGWPERLNGAWLTPNQSLQDSNRERIRRKIEFAVKKTMPGSVRLQGTFTGNGGGSLEGVVVPLKEGTYHYSYCTLKGANYKVDQPIILESLDLFKTVTVKGHVFNSITMEPINIAAVKTTAAPTRKTYITDIITVPDEQSIPDGFELIRTCCNSAADLADLNRNSPSSAKVFLAVKRDPMGIPITDVSVVWEFEGVTGSFEVVREFDGKSCNLNEGTTSPALFLCVRRASLTNGPPKQGLMDIAVLRVGGVSSAKPPEGFEKVEKSAGSMRHESNLNMGNIEQHRLFLCKQIAPEPPLPIDHVLNGVYETTGWGYLQLNAVLVTEAHLVQGKFTNGTTAAGTPTGKLKGFLISNEPLPAPQNAIGGGADEGKAGDEGRDVMPPAEVAKSETRSDWTLLGVWNDPTHPIDLPCRLSFSHPYGTCTGSYTDGKDSFAWEFVRDDFVQIAFKKDYDCKYRDGELEFGKRCFRHDISQMVLNFFSESVIPGIDCDTCRERTPHTSRLHCAKSPEHLMLTVKRMSFDWRTQKNIKRLMDVHFSPTVSLPPLAVPAEGDESFREEAARSRAYGLFAVIVHSGKTSNSGHYYCYARSGDADDLHKPDSTVAPWLKINDSRVEFVEGGFEAMRRTIKKSVSANAYILVYKRLPDSKLASHASALPGESLATMGNTPEKPAANIGEDVAESDGEDDEEALLAAALALSEGGLGSPSSPAKKIAEAMTDETAVSLALKISNEDLPAPVMSENMKLSSLPDWYSGVEANNIEFLVNDASMTDPSWSELVHLTAKIQLGVEEGEVL